MTGQKVYFLKGLPGAGKTTWARQKCLSTPQTVRVNKDDLRSMLCLRGGGENEAVVISAERELVRTLLGDGLSVVIDNTHFNVAHERYYRFLAEGQDAEFEVVDFSGVPLETCLQRNSLRINDKVPENVIRQMWEKNLKNRRNDG